MSSLNLYLTAVTSLTDSTAIASKWSSVCNNTLKLVDATVCATVQQAIQADVSGNTGKRAGKYAQSNSLAVMLLMLHTDTIMCDFVTDGIWCFC